MYSSFIGCVLQLESVVIDLLWLLEEQDELNKESPRF
jgi:hypothetical protein